jgi:hypothetical protein
MMKVRYDKGTEARTEHRLAQMRKIQTVASKQ